jgi:transcriptional regulator with XRE-family HTH domain
MTPLDDTIELGRRIRAARAYADVRRPAFARMLEISVSQVDDWEAGLGLGESVEEREELACRILAATGCPPALLGLRRDELEERVSALEDRLNELASGRDESDDWLTKQDLAERLGVSEKAIQRHVTPGRVAGGRNWYRLAAARRQFDA